MASRAEELEQEGTPTVPLPTVGGGTMRRDRDAEAAEAAEEAAEMARLMEHPLVRAGRVRLERADQLSDRDEPWLSVNNPAIFVGDLDEDDD
jgi:hypothetical protein